MIARLRVGTWSSLEPHSLSIALPGQDHKIEKGFLPTPLVLLRLPLSWLILMVNYFYDILVLLCFFLKLTTYSYSQI